MARPGTFQPGVSGNPGGKSREHMEVITMARNLSPDAIIRLGEWMKSNNPKASVAAANAILDRAFGKPAQALTGADGEGPAELLIRWLTAPPEK